MRLALKVVLATVLGVLAVLTVFGWLRAQREIALFDSDMRKDHALIATTLSVCVASTWSSAGPERALELIERANADRPGVRIGWVHRDGRTAMGAPVFTLPSVAELGAIDHAVADDPDSSEHDFLVTRLPVRDRGQLLGAIEIAESLKVRDDYVQTSIASTIGATMVLVALSGTIALVLGVWWVGRPLKLLASKAQRVGRGDLAEPLAFKQADEIGQLAREVDSMCEKLAEANARSEAETSARIRALEQLRHADRLITIGRLSAGIAHELGTPLNVIGGRVKMLRQGRVDATSGADYLVIIAEQVERMTSIIRQLMDFGRVRESKMGAADLVAIARSVARLVEPMARKRGVTLEVSAPGPVYAVGDAARLEQVVSNLVVNAVHACSEGGRVEVQAGSSRDGVEGTPGGPLVYLRVVDDGHGMDEVTATRVFEPFFTTKDIGQGTGLGLSVAHGIIQEHGGAIHVRSEVGSGSAFSILLPAVAT
jgi:two-component system NtrC family sensor kinase